MLLWSCGTCFMCWLSQDWWLRFHISSDLLIQVLNCMIVSIFLHVYIHVLKLTIWSYHYTVIVQWSCTCSFLIEYRIYSGGYYKTSLMRPPIFEFKGELFLSGCHDFLLVFGPSFQHFKFIIFLVGVTFP